MTKGTELFLLVSKAIEIESIRTPDWDILGGAFWWTVKVVSAFSGPCCPIRQLHLFTVLRALVRAGNFFTTLYPTRTNTLTYYILVRKPL